MHFVSPFGLERHIGSHSDIASLLHGHRRRTRLPTFAIPTPKYPEPANLLQGSM
jgi:hypothetical protein